MAQYLLSNFSTKFTYNRLSKNFDIKDVHTVMNYFGYLESTYLVFSVPKFSFKLRQQMRAPRKLYAIDTGLANMISFSFSENIGRYMENIVAIDLRRGKIYWHQLWSIYYWQDPNGREVDVVITEGKKVLQLIQVTYASALNDIASREMEAIIKASEDLKCKNFKVITYDYEAKEKIKGRNIDFIPLWKWLLTSWVG